MNRHIAKLLLATAAIAVLKKSFVEKSFVDRGILGDEPRDEPRDDQLPTPKFVPVNP